MNRDLLELIDRIANHFVGDDDISREEGQRYVCEILQPYYDRWVQAQVEAAQFTKVRAKLEAAENITKGVLRALDVETASNLELGSRLEAAEKERDELKKVDQWTANVLTEHAEAVGVDPDRIDYINDTTKAIIAMWAENSRLKAEVKRNHDSFCAETLTVSRLQADVARLTEERDGLAGELHDAAFRVAKAENANSAAASREAALVEANVMVEFLELFAMTEERGPMFTRKKIEYECWPGSLRDTIRSNPTFQGMLHAALARCSPPAAETET